MNTIEQLNSEWINIEIRDKKLSWSQEYVRAIQNKLNEILVKFNFKETLIQNREGVFLCFDSIENIGEFREFFDSFFWWNQWNNIFFFKNINHLAINDLMYDFDRLKTEWKPVRLWDKIGILEEEKKKKIWFFKINISWSNKVWFDSASCQFNVPIKAYLMDENKKVNEVLLEFDFDEFFSIAWKNLVRFWLVREDIEKALSWDAQSHIIIARTLDMKEGVNWKIEDMIKIHEELKPTELEDWSVNNRKMLWLYTKAIRWQVFKKRLPAIPWIKWIDIMWNLLIPPEVEEVDIYALAWDWMTVQMWDDWFEYLVSSENWFVQKLDWKYIVETFIINKRPIWPETWDLTIDTEFMQQIWEIMKTYTLTCRNCDVFEWDVCWSLISIWWNISVSPNIVWWSVTALDWNVICKWKVFTWAKVWANKWKITCMENAEYSTFFWKNLLMHRVISSDLIAEEVVIDELISWNISWRKVKIWKISKNPLKSDNDNHVCRITIWIKGFDIEMKSFNNKRNILNNIKTRFETNSNRISELLSNEELNNYFINLKRFKDNPGMELTPLMKDLFSSMELKYKSEIEEYYKLTKQCSADNSMIARYEWEIKILDEMIKWFMLSESESVLEIWSIEEWCEVEVRFAYIYDKLSSDKYEWENFFEIYQINMNKVHSDIYKFTRVWEDWKPKSFANTVISFKELFDFAKENVWEVLSDKATTIEKVREKRKDFVKYKIRDVSEVLKWNREYPRFDFHKLQEFTEIDELFKPIKVMIDWVYVWELFDLSHKWIGIRLFMNSCEANSLLSEDSFEFNKKHRIEFSYMHIWSLIQFRLDISTKNVLINKEEWIMRLGWEFVDLSRMDDNKLWAMFAYFRVEIIKHMKDNRIPRAFKYESEK